MSRTYNFQSFDQLCRENGQKCKILKFQLNCILGVTFCSNWLKFGPNSLRMIKKRCNRVFLKILIFFYFMLTFISAIKSKVHASMTYKEIESCEPTRFKILTYFRSLEAIIFKILTSFIEKMTKNAKFLNFN